MGPTESDASNATLLGCIRDEYERVVDASNDSDTNKQIAKDNMEGWWSELAYRLSKFKGQPENEFTPAGYGGEIGWDGDDPEQEVAYKAAFEELLRNTHDRPSL